HYIPAWSIRIEGSASVTYSGDTAPSDAVVELARGSDLFVCEATLSEPETRDDKGHCTPEQAATMACGADVRRLLLTHFWFDRDLADVERRGRAVYRGPLEIAQDGLSIDV
ncbi:MAG: MBL fold metallo-hydrolase, partial [Dehalococcoidia bacterium]